MNKSQLVQSIITAHPLWTATLIYDYLNTPREIPNPIPQGEIAPNINITELAELIEPAQRLLFQQPLLQGAWESFLTNFAQGRTQDVMNTVENMFASGLLNDTTRKVMQDALVSSQELIPDPNWQPTVKMTPLEEHGVGSVFIGEIEAAMQK